MANPAAHVQILNTSRVYSLFSDGINEDNDNDDDDFMREFTFI